MRLPFTFRWPWLRREPRGEQEITASTIVDTDLGPISLTIYSEARNFTTLKDHSTKYGPFGDMHRAQLAMMDGERMRPFDEAVARYRRFLCLDPPVS